MNTVDISPTKSFSNLYDKITNNLGKSFNSSNVLIFIIILIVFSLLFSNLGNSNAEMTPLPNNSSANILEIILWSVFVFLLLANGLQYFFGIEASASVKNVLDGKPEVGIELSEESKSLLKKTLPVIGESTKKVEERKKKPKKEVFYIKDNVYNYEEAKAVCKAHDAELADYNQLEKVYSEGGEWCGYGWSRDQMILFPTQKKTWNKLQTIDGHENDCGRPGINGGYIENTKAKFGVNCYGVKRSPNDYEVALLDQMKKEKYPTSSIDQKFNENVNKYKKDVKENKFVITPFNNTKWNL
jgi:hypothetical protein|tara:strand:- start:1146 stop:2042 length:897 start_codon:yes stop_codon:yes gene_type:complete